MHSAEHGFASSILIQLWYETIDIKCKYILICHFLKYNFQIKKFSISYNQHILFFFKTFSKLYQRNCRFAVLNDHTLPYQFEKKIGNRTKVYKEKVSNLSRNSWRAAQSNALPTDIRHDVIDPRLALLMDSPFQASAMSAKLCL